MTEKTETRGISGILEDCAAVPASPPTIESVSMGATGDGTGCEAQDSVPVRRFTTQVISNSVPTRLPPVSMKRSMSVQLPERLPPLGSLGKLYHLSVLLNPFPCSILPNL